jgi:ferredoxin
MTDVLRWPLLGRLGRHRRGRLLLQLPLLAVAVVVVVHGLLGPPIAPRNLATVLTWVHYRGLLVIALLAVGNLFCAACPMMLVRDAGRAAFHPAWRWPRLLRSKWPAIVLFAGVLFTYELFDLWSLPRATAWLVLGYFGTALVVDLLFAGASFCKYVCPIGQFNFISSTLSPLELRVRSVDTCRRCRGVDCIRGRTPASDALTELKFGAASPPSNTPTELKFGAASPPSNTPTELKFGAASPPSDTPTELKFGAASPPRSLGVARNIRPAIVQRGCELNLFLPAKVGNLDCTMCFDCVRACPHDNIALASRVPGAELSVDGRRSGLGRLSRRADLAALAVLFTFAGVLNALAMTGPAHHLQMWIVAASGITSDAWQLALVFAGALVALPLVLVGGAALLSRALGAGGSLRDVVVRFSFALVPLGVFVWTAHYAFHFLTGALAIVPAVQSAVMDLVQRPVAGEPLWTLTGMRPGSVYPIQLGCLVLGAAAAIGVAFRISEHQSPKRAAAVALPWASLIVLLAAAAAWVLSQPMEMRTMGRLGAHPQSDLSSDVVR